MRTKPFIQRICVFVVLSVAFLSYVHAQEWRNNLPKNKVKNHTLTLKDYQKAFYSYFKEAKAGKVKEVKQEGEKKDETLEKFKRWEWYWETRVNPVTGTFPHTNAYDVYQQYLKAHPDITSQNSYPWKSVGPFHSPGGYAGLGRINCVAFSPVDTNVLYVGSASGGVWKTSNGGTDWTPLGDFNKTLGVADLVVVNNGGDDIIYLATGDRDAWDSRSAGVLKSTDGGQTWNPTGLHWEPWQGNMVYRLLVDPNDTTTLYAATNNGLYKTTDAGRNWNIISGLYFRDIEFQPGSNTRMYGSILYKGDVYYSTDAGQTWTKAIDNPDNNRTELAVSRDSANVVYAVMANSNSGLRGIYRSEDAGQTYTLVFNKLNLLGWAKDGSDSGGQGWYDLSFAVDPYNTNKVFVGGVNTWMSEDGGKSWKISNHWIDSSNGQNAVVHADKHELVYRGSTNTLFECNDGGIYKTKNGKSWNYIGSGLVVSQIYRLGTSATVAGEVITGLQDNGTKLLSGIKWNDVLGGDGMECLIDYTNANTQYGEVYFGQIYRTKDHWQSGTWIDSGLTGNAAWVTPYVINPVYHKTLYVGYQDIFKSTNQGDNWVKLSNWGGRPLNSIAVSASNTNYIYAATFNIIYKTSDGGKTWNNITANLPVNQANITYIAVKNNDPNTVWVTMGEYNDLGVFETTNGGISWHNISSGLPAIPVNSIVQNKLHSPVELFAGTDAGVFVRKGSSDWQPFNTQLPNVVVDELEIHYDSTTHANLYAATFGRGLWSVDVSGEINDSLSANFKTDSLEGVAPFTVHFTDLSSGRPVSWKWNFGDGSTDTVQNPVHTYQTTGTYSVTEIVSNNNYSDTLTKIDLISVKPQHSPLADNLKHYYKFDDSFIDVIGGTNGEGNSVAFDSSGVIHHCVLFYGTGSSYIETNNYSGFNYLHDGSNFTISVWEKHNSADHSSKHILGDDIGADRRGVFFKVDSTDVQFIVGRNYPYPAFNHTWDSVFPKDTTMWHHLVLTYNNSLTSNQYTLYVDGKNVGSASQIHPCEQGDSYNPMRFGINKTWGTLQPFKGDLDELAFWDRTLSAQEVAELYNNGKGLQYPFVQKLVAKFSADTVKGLQHLKVQFTDKSTGKPVSWLWDFGNGDTSHLQNPVATYDSLGYYTVTLTVSDGKDTVSNSIKNYIKVKNIVSRFAADTTEGLAPLTVHFTDRSVGHPLSWQWDFNNDGIFDSTSQNPSWTYTKPGLYSVALYVANQYGIDTLVRTNYIHVHVNIPDSNFRKVINERLGYTYPETVIHNPTKQELATITGLDASNRGITNINGAQYLVNCSNLSFDNDQIGTNRAPGENGTSDKGGFIMKDKIYHQEIALKKRYIFTKSSSQTHENKVNKIEDFSPLAGLIQLKKLSLYNTGITNINFLSGLTNLIQLTLWRNSITDISALSNLTNLQYLDLDDNKVTDISSLSNLTNLQLLWFDDNKPNNINALSQLRNLWLLGLNSDSISNIGPLSGLTSLNDLFIYNNNISDLGPVQNLTNLYSLDISSNKISNAGLLTGLKYLHYLYLGNNPIQDLSFLNKMTQLEGLGIWNMHINDFHYIQNLTGLNTLYIDNNNFTSLKGIENFPSLSSLGATNNPLYDIRGIETLPLQYFYVYNCRISDFAPLVENAKIIGELQYVDISGNPASKESMESQIPVLQTFISYGYWPQEDSLAACYPVPHNKAVNVPDTAFLTWQANFNHNNGVTYNVYLGTDLYNQPLVAKGLTTTSYPSVLQKGKNYWWRIESIFNGDTVRSGVWYFNTNTSHQLITADPVSPTDNKAVTITFNAALGNAGLKGFTGVVYAHTGVITDKSTSPSDWRYVKAAWDQNIAACRMTRIDTNLYLLKISPSIRAYYGVPSGEHIRKLAFVFRSADGSQAGRTASGGDIFYDVRVDSAHIPQKIPLSKGWNIMSFNVTPDTVDMLSMLDTLIHRNELVKAMDEKGGFVQDVPGTGWVNTIGDMANTEGYYIKLTDNDVLNETGRLVKLPFDIPLQKGWNIIGYPLQSQQDAKAALHTLIDSAYFVKAIDESGGFIQNVHGIGWINTIGNLEPGQGYYVKVSKNTHLTLNKPTNKAAVLDKTFSGKPVLTSQYFKKAFKRNPYFPMNIVVSTMDLNGYAVQPGDEIAAYDKGICVGTGIVSKDVTKPVIIVASMDDPSTTQKDGFSAGDKISFRYMSSGLSQPVDLTARAQTGKLLFTPLGTTVCGIKASPEGINKRIKSQGDRLRIYPNPAKGYATFEITNKETSRVRMEILNLNGKVVKVLVDKVLQKGSTRIRYNTSLLSPGVYDVQVVYRNSGKEFIHNQKLIITK